MGRLRRAMVVIASAAGFLGLVLLGDAKSDPRVHPLRTLRSPRPGVELVSKLLAGCSTAAGQRELFCSIDTGPTILRARRSGGAAR